MNERRITRDETIEALPLRKVRERLGEQHRVSVDRLIRSAVERGAELALYQAVREGRIVASVREAGDPEPTPTEREFVAVVAPARVHLTGYPPIRATATPPIRATATSTRDRCGPLGPALAATHREAAEELLARRPITLATGVEYYVVPLEDL